MPRVLVGQFFHETHSFSPLLTSASDLVVRRGEALAKNARGATTTLSGIVRKLTTLNYEILPSLGFFASPGGRIEHGLYESLRDEFISFVRRQRIDAVALDLHGAMGTTELSDADGDLLTRLRWAVGPDLPIGVGLDMHAHVTRAMLEAVDICIGCKECPHTDFAECGEKVVVCLDAMLEGRLKPVRVMAKAPAMALDGGLTARPPLSEVKALAAKLAQSSPEIWDVTLFQAYRFGDFDDAKNQGALVLANASPERAKQLSEELARWFWNNRERFRDETMVSLEQAFDLVSRQPARRPFVLGDVGDRVLAGAPGDGTTVLAFALARPEKLKGVIPLTDPKAVNEAARAGIGAYLPLRVGGSISPGEVPVDIVGQVTGLGDGEFVISGPVFGGEHSSLGPTATVLVEGRLTLLLTSKPGLTHTPSAFTGQGIDLSSQDFIVVKSGQHFPANFGDMATPLFVATPGLTYPAKGHFPWKNPHFWPEEDIANPDLDAKVYVGRAQVGA